MRELGYGSVMNLYELCLANKFNFFLSTLTAFDSVAFLNTQIYFLHNTSFRVAGWKNAFLHIDSSLVQQVAYKH